MLIQLPLKQYGPGHYISMNSQVKVEYLQATVVFLDNNVEKYFS